MNLDRYLKRVSQRLSRLVGMVGLTPYQLGMALAVVSMVSTLVVPAFWLPLAEACARNRCAGHFAAMVDPVTLPVLVINLAMGLAICGSSLWLCVRRQREWRTLQASGLMMSPPRLLATMLFRKPVLEITSWLCAAALTLELLSVLDIVLGLDPSWETVPGTASAVKGAGDALSYAFSFSAASSYAHALFNDYLLLSPPRIRPRNARKASRLPAGLHAGM